ncbi:putative F-box protein [Raphanus sativus]|uniref:F-box protein At2g02030 n=1 Tax=Raphanus sativus TaxID=3726 RepID=A0A6J0NNF1_RAPSA|nr:putative F-box protein At2g02030 [Raphanus sativus]KAJ4894014.1 putative F-box protein [Raphanus sativus]
MLASMEICERMVRESKRRRKGRREWKIEIPNDVMEEIVMRLPVRSIARFQTVSKHWESVIRSRDFGARHMSHQRRSKDPKLMFVSYGQNHIGFEQRDLETTSLEESFELKIEEINGAIAISECCDGLVCFYGLTYAVRVVNMATKTLVPPLPLAKFQQVHKYHPDPDLEEEMHDVSDDEDDRNPVPVPFVLYTRFGFGKDSVTGRYKIVWLYNIYPATLNKKKKTRCEVFDFEEWRWRFVTTRPLDHHQILSKQMPSFANGSLYWLTTGDERGYPSTQTKLIVFDIHTEMFRVTSTPPFISPGASGDKIGLCNLDGHLCISELKSDCKQEFWWRVEECGDKWERIFSVDLNSTSCWFGRITSLPLTPLAISRVENKVVLSLTYQGSLVDFDLDPDSTVYHLYYPGYYGLAVPYFPSLSLVHATF